MKRRARGQAPWSRRFAVVLALGAALAGASGARANDVEEIAALRSMIQESGALYATDPVRAREIAGEAFVRFESTGVDRSFAARDLSAYKSLESTWLKLVSAMRAKAPEGEIRAVERSLLEQLDAANPRGASRGSLAVNSLVIILREGFEAILVISAVAATLRATGQTAGLRPLHAGALCAVVASLLLAVAAHAIGGFGAASEAIEGITCLVAVVVLFLTSYWLISRVEGQRWQRFIRERVQKAASGGRLGGLFLLAFVVVFREGFETILFYQALAGEAAATAGGPAALFGGFGAGLILLALLWAGIRWFGVHVPVRRFFAVTGVLLYLLAIKFAGVGIRELQEAGWITPAPISWVPEIPWLRDWFGVTPDAMTLAAQSLLILAVVVGWGLSRATRPAGGLGIRARDAA